MRIIIISIITYDIEKYVLATSLKIQVHIIKSIHFFKKIIIHRIFNPKKLSKINDF